MSKYLFPFLLLTGLLALIPPAVGQRLTSETIKNIKEYALSEHYQQMSLPYTYNQLEPYIDASTMEIHFTKHHAAYTANLNKAIEGQPWAKTPLLELFLEIDKYPDAVRNNGGGYYNHLIFWQMLRPSGGGLPGGALAEAINKSFGSFDNFQQQFSTAASTRFGSGWAWLAIDVKGNLFISSTANQDNPLMSSETLRGIPLLTIDVWEHAYYLKYQNKRVDYVKSFWSVVNWDEVSRRYVESMKSLSR